MSDIDILVSEVGPRDGLQSIKTVMPTEAKKAWIAAEAAAGVREIEVASFVPPKLLPQMADAAEIVAYAKTIPNLDVIALVPNFKGAENAIKAGADKIGLPLSCSETHSQANLKKTHDQVKHLVDLGKEKGFLTYDEVNGQAVAVILDLWEDDVLWRGTVAYKTTRNDSEDDDLAEGLDRTRAAAVLVQ